MVNRAPSPSRLKRSQLIAVAVVALMILTAIPVQVANGQGAYSEKLNIFVSGSTALWYFTFTGVNGSSKLSAFESTPGLSWYNVSAISTQGMLSDMQVFGPVGYNILPVPFIPSQGLFLTVGSDSFADATSAASALDTYLLTSFVSLSNGTGTYAFYSPISFKDLIPTTLFSFLPTSEGGFAKAVSSSFFQGSDAPFIVLEGQKAAAGFSHSLIVGSMSSTALSATDQPNLISLFAGTISSIQASNRSSSSVIQFRFLDGILVSSDKATVTSNSVAFTSSYTLNLAAGGSVSTINATVVQQPAPLLALRSVDVGVLQTGDNLAVTLSLKDLSASETITRVSFSDDWWNKTGDFKLLSGSSTVSTSSIGPGASITPGYTLQYTGNGTGSLTIPASTVGYQYVVNGHTFNGTATLNPIRLSLGTGDAVVYAIATPVGGFDQALGTKQKYNVTVTNVGTLPAQSVVVDGQTIPGGSLGAKVGSLPGGTQSVTISLGASGLLKTNSTQSFSATYQNPSGKTLNASTNVISDTLSHTSMTIGFPQIAVGAQLATLSNLKTNLTLSFTTTNPGFANVTSFKASDALPPGLGCGTVNGTGLSCSGNVVTISYPLLNRSSTFTTTMKYNLTSPLNYVLAPFEFQAMTSGYNFTGRSNAVAIPAGLVLSKEFEPSQLFGGMNSQVRVSGTNSGPLPIYNATLGTTVDSFDTLSSTATLTKTASIIAPGSNLTVSYGVTASQTFGNQTGTAPTASLYFAGSSFSIDGAVPRVDIYQPLAVTISTYPTTPEEGKSFTITFNINNPSGVPVSNVLFTLPVPSGVGLSSLYNASVASGVLTFSPGSLAGHSAATATAIAVAGSGITIPFAKAKLTFTYGGSSISGVVPSGSGIAISEDITTRYLIPTAFVLLALLFTAYYLRRKAGVPISSAPPK